MIKSFASDNWSGVHPKILDALVKANTGHQAAYGADEYTRLLTQKMNALFKKEVEMFLVYNGTGANVSALASGLFPYEATICSTHAHLNQDECGAPERFTGTKLITIDTPDAKLTPELIKKHIKRIGDQHAIQPKFVSITQPNEYGVTYTVKEINEIADLAHQNGMYVHMDGARIANALVALNSELSTVTSNVDILSFGGTKNGMMFGEAVIFLNRDLAKATQFHRKQAMQLHSKMRYIAAQFLAYLEQDLWLKNAKHANDMMRYLIDLMPEPVKITQKVCVNAAFAIMPLDLIKKLQGISPFYIWDEEINEVRLMCSFDTQKEEIETFIQEIETYYRTRK